LIFVREDSRHLAQTCQGLLLARAAFRSRRVRSNRGVCRELPFAGNGSLADGQVQGNVVPSRLRP
jgi:hypothetical protein